MKIIRTYQDCPPDNKGSVLAIGNFDGVHKGHVAVISKATELAAACGGNAAVLTFEPHPLKVLRPEGKPFRLTSEAQKAALIESLAVKQLFTVNFDKAFSTISAADFVKKILVDELAVKHVVTGEDFIFGHNRTGNHEMLSRAAGQYGFGYSRVVPVGNKAGIFSSSSIRAALGRGELATVKAILGRNFELCGAVVEGRKQGRELGFPTINIAPGDYIRPAFGVYAVNIRLAGRDKLLHGAANFGIRPTLSGIEELLEVHIFDFAENIYGQQAAVELIEYIRPEQKFAGLAALKQQITEDCIKIRELFA